MDAAPFEGGFERRSKVAALGDPRSLGSIALRIFHEIGITKGQAKIRETVDGLLPPDHAVGEVLKNENDQIELEANRRLHLLRIHHEAAVAADGHYPPFRAKDRRHHRGRQTGTHRRQCVVEQYRVGNVGPIVPREPDLIHAVIKCDDSILWNNLSDVVNNALRGHRPTVFLAAVADVAQNAFAQAQQLTAVVQSAFDAICEEFQARADISHDRYLTIDFKNSLPAPS